MSLCNHCPTLKVEFRIECRIAVVYSYLINLLRFSVAYPYPNATKCIITYIYITTDIWNKN